MGNIVLLDELTINKIAAGEVIERPASVIKEMIENSIDAGATNITVEIKNGGISYIRVVDNGKGIAQDDLEIAFERHATSKIRTAEDLNTVTSMGFRGEALASIAAISNVELVSKTKDQQIGYKVVVEGGDVLSKEEAGCQVGTAITVQNLFYNTPVRYKFLKKDYTESGYIEDVITREALIHPEIAFKLINTGKTVIQTTGNGDLKSVIYSIYGKDIEEATIDVNYEYEGIKVTGVVGKPEIARSNRSNQIFFVNKRYIKDKNLSAAVTEAFKGMIPIGKFGFVILNLKMNPKKVDVNVHPAKLEVRFEEEAKVFKAIYHTIKDALLKTELVADPVKESEEEVSLENTEKIISNKKDRQEEKLEGNQEEQAKEERGLFGWRRNKKENVQTGEKPNIISQIYNEKQEGELPKAIQKSIDKHGTENMNITDNTSKISGEPVDTFDVLEKLKKLKMQLEQEVNEHKEANADLEVKEDADTEYKESIESKTGKEEVAVAEEESKGEEKQEIQEEAKTEKTEPLTKEELKQEMTEEEAKAEFKETKSKLDQMLNEQEEVSTDFTEMYLKTFGIMPPTEQIKQEEAEKENQAEDAKDIIQGDNISMFEEMEEHKKILYKFIGIAFKTYIILEINNELYILDQHAAHERILYEKVKKNYYSNSTKNSQLLLLPDVITLTHKEMDIAKDNMKMFEKAGFELMEFGENTIKLSGVPDICLDLNTKDLFLETLDEINTVARTAKQEIEEKFLATVACKAAVKANMALTEEEVNSLLDKLLELPNPFTCPHGRPTAIKMTKYDIERKFARK